MLRVHDRLGDFEIIRLLGKGGMGEVYEAHQFNPERQVALKVLAPWLADDEEALRRFFQESSVPAKLDHPNIVRIITTGQTPDGVAYFTMHLVRGISLSAMIKHSNASSSQLPTRTVASAETPSSAPASKDLAAYVHEADGAGETYPPLEREYRRDRFTTVARIGLQAARALAYAHQQGHLHRDIKPSNLMVDHHDHVYLVDFGLTRTLGPGSDSTNPGAVIGTPWYMSPEQADGKLIDARSDIYSLGATLYELASQGLGPFTASRDDKQSVLAQVRAGQTLPLRSLAPGIPPTLEHIIVKAMQLKPAKRYASASEMAKDLDAFLGHSSRPTSDAPTEAESTSRRRRPMLVAAFAVPALIVAVVVYFFVNMPPAVVVVPPKRNATEMKWDGTQAFPESLRNAEWDVPSFLLRNNSDPLWTETVFGKAKPRPFLGAKHLQLFAKPEDPGAIALLADPDRRSFEFTIDIERLRPDGPLTNECGLLFGWRRDYADTLDPARFFYLEIEDAILGNQPIDQVRIGMGRIIKNGEGTGTIEWRSIGDHAIPLGPQEQYHTITIKVHKNRASVLVPNQRPKLFDLAELQLLFPEASRLSVTGAVGIWSKNGRGMYKNASIKYPRAD